MRAAVWLLVLFAVAAAVALFAGNNQGIVTVFWPPTRVDLSLNFALLLLILVFMLLYGALRALQALFSLPVQARQWRLQQKERNLHAALLDSVVQLLAGRFTRARKSALAALAQEHVLAGLDARLPQSQQVRVLAHLMAAESAQALQDRAARDAHLQHALNEGRDRGGMSAETRDGVQLRSARWALEDRNAVAALDRLAELPQGVQRRTLALRLRLKATRLSGRTQDALDTARLLAKHRAFSEDGARSIVRGLALELVGQAHDPAQLMRAWSELDPAERAIPEVAIQAAQRMVVLRGDLAMARAWLLPVWERSLAQPDALSDSQRAKLVRALEAGLDTVDPEWLARIEGAQRAQPRDAHLQYLAGMACMKRQLWGKAQQLLTQAGLGQQDAELHRRAWVAVAQLAEQREDAEQALMAWKRAAQGG
ncbi:MAG: heme biosynthesis protein HemY [Pseudacidovorax sp.]|uniref:heme biosynthesis protein HemY n=1 Tax=Pseudacidovorax sp. TaxID=1934311 RepID=UPI001B40C961|nr:heme biosynthesis HemY N-terminal domain-containing protein [Pseudacidovorax sp.]MBP6893712.1 heme biosynthesis protein HemY [Pseudacidovorax sp.]